jgi:transposase
MYIDVVPNRNSPPAVLLREAWREGKRIRKSTIANLSKWPPGKVEALRCVLRGERVFVAEQVFQIERSLPHGHVAATLGTLRGLRLDYLLGSKKSRHRQLVIAMVVARILNPRSKLATAGGVDTTDETSSLGETLGLGKVDVDELYEALDWLVRRQPRIEAKLAERHLEAGALVLYDLTSTYFEGRHCTLARMGYSRDGKKNRLQIVFGLITDADGRPIAVEVFEGNTADPSTVPSLIDKLRSRFGLERIVLVGDRGMITAARIREDLRPNGLQWITSLRAPAIRKLAQGGALQMSLFDQQDLAEITEHPDYPGERLIVCLNPLLRDERARKRQQLLEATERELDKVVEATRRQRRRLRGQDAIGLRVGRVLGRFKLAKHFRLKITDTSFAYQRQRELIETEAALDGLYVIRTNVAAHTLSCTQAVQAYKNLSQVERAFRTIKTVDLKVRPIYHRLPDRVRAHVFLCMLAYYVQWHMRRRLAPLLFCDEDPCAGRARRGSVVAPAQRSPRAEEKVRAKTTEDGLPVHAFRDLLTHLATLCRNHVRPRIDNSVAFVQYTVPTALQTRAFELLDVSPTKM